MGSGSTLSLYTFIFLATLSTSNALNDWTKPCFEGVCSYDIPDAGDTSSGSLKIWADSTDAIADITDAADWEIVGCKKDAAAQDIRIVCKTEDSEKCAKLFSSGSANGKIVRLPEACGELVFAHIANSFQPEDQSIPSDIAKRLARRAGAPPRVEGLTLDSDFASVDASKFGKIMFAVQGSNVPGAKGEIPIGSPSLVRRGLFDKIADIGGDILDEVKDLGEKGAKLLVKGAEEGLDKLEDGAKEVAEFGEDIVDDVKDLGKQGLKVLFKGAEKGLEKIGDGVKEATEFGREVIDKLQDIEVNDEIVFEPLQIDETFNLFREKLTCDGVTTDASSDVKVKVDTLVKLGVMAAGTLVPPDIEDFAVTATLSADLASNIEFNGGLTGIFDTGKIKFFEAGLPGLTFPGILTVGPSFRVDGQALAKLDLNVNLDVGINYKVSKAQFVFPPRDEKKGGNFEIVDTPLKLSASPSVDATGSVEAHLIPSLNLGLDAIGGIVKANVFVNLDASATAQLELQASAEGTVEIPTKRHFVSRLPPVDRGQEDAEVEQENMADADGETASASATEVAQPTESGVTTSLSTGFGGCFKVFAGLSVNAGAEGSFFGLFDAKETVNLFQQTFDLFKKCFGNQKRSSHAPQIRRSWHTIDKTRRVHKISQSRRQVTLERREFVCPDAAVAAPENVVESENALLGA